MLKVLSWQGLHNPVIASSVEELRRDTLRLLLAIAGVSCLAWHWATIMMERPDILLPHRALFAIVIAGLLTSYFAWRSDTSVGAHFFLVTSVLSITAAVWLLGSPTALVFYPLVVLAAVVLLSPLAGLCTAVGSVGLLALLRQFGLAASPTADRLTETALATLLTVVLAWVLGRNMFTAVEWALHSYDQAQINSQLAQRQRAELVQTLQQLDTAYYRLEQANVHLELARAAAEAAKQAKSEFAATVSHELRTPLNLIIGFSEMMVLSPDESYDEVLPPGYRADIEAIYRNAGHISTLIDDILDLSQIDAHRMGLSRENCSLAEIVDLAVASVSRLFRSKKLGLETRLPLNLPPVVVDATRIRQVLINLLANAARFTDRGGVTISAEPRAREVIVSVSDTGTGIPANEVARIFEPFQQASDRGRPRIGSGLGLAISKRFVEMHGGSMWAQSRPGEGMIFSFSLPLTDAPVVSSGVNRLQTRLEAIIAGKERSVLALDSDGEAVQIFQRYLDGYRVVRAANHQELADLADRESFQALLLTAPPARSIRLAAGVRPISDRLPTFVCPFQSRLATAQELGVAECLVRPISAEQMRAAFRRLGNPVRSVLIVDDDPDLVQLLGRIIRSLRRGCHVWHAPNRRIALELLGERRPDVMILSLSLSDVDGNALLEALRADPILSEIPIMAITDRGQERRSITANSVTIYQAGGLSVGEAMACLKASLDVLLRPGVCSDPTR